MRAASIMPDHTVAIGYSFRQIGILKCRPLEGSCGYVETAENS